MKKFFRGGESQRPKTVAHSKSIQDFSQIRPCPSADSFTYGGLEHKEGEDFPSSLPSSPLSASPLSPSLPSSPSPLEELEAFQSSSSEEFEPKAASSVSFAEAARPVMVHKRVRSISSPQIPDLKLAGSVESLLNSIGTEVDGIIDLGPDEEGELGENIWTEKGTVTLIEGSGKRQVRSGNLNQLVLHFTEASSATNAGAEFTDAFMITFQTFCTPYQFVRKLCERFKVPPCPQDADPQEYESTFKIPIQLRVIKIFKKWITIRYDQDLAYNPLLVEELALFIENVVARDHPTAAKNLGDALQAAREQFTISLLSSGKSTLDISSMPEYAREEAREGEYPSFPSLVHFDVREIAAQMTLLDARFFCAIRLSELVGQAWNKNKRKAGNVIRSIAHTNRVSNWVVASILSEETPKARAKIMTNFINLLSALKTYRNYLGIMAVLSGLGHSSVSRLKLTHKELSPKVIKIHQAFTEMMRSVSSFKNYREALESSEEPAVPFLGVTLSDLTFIEDGNHDFVLGGDINWQKRTLLARILIEFTERQRLAKYYQIEETEMMHGFLARVNDVSKGGRDSYEISLVLEPRTRSDTVNTSKSKNK